MRHRDSIATLHAGLLAGPLTKAEVQEGGEVGERLRGELLSAIEKLRPEERPALALSRLLGVDRNICQRVVAGLDPRLDPLLALTKMPGSEGLRLFANALAQQGQRSGRSGRAVRRTALTAAIDAYMSFVRKAGGSQAGLIRRLEMSERGRGFGVAGDNLATRRKLFEVATELQGHAVETLVSIAAVRPIPGSEGFIEGLNVMGFIGLRACSAPVTLELRNFTLRHEAKLVAEETLYEPLTDGGDRGLNLIDEFCSSPLPSSVFDSFDGGSRTIVEPGLEQHDPMDIVMGSRWRPYLHPTLHADPCPIWWRALRIDRPARRAVLDVYLHRSLASASIPSVGTYLWHPGITGNPAKDWRSRLPGRCTLEMLGTGIGRAGTQAWGRHAALTARSLELAGWDPSEMVGFRCEVDYPTWASVLVMSFDFSGAATHRAAPDGA